MSRLLVRGAEFVVVANGFDSARRSLASAVGGIGGAGKVGVPILPA